MEGRPSGQHYTGRQVYTGQDSRATVQHEQLKPPQPTNVHSQEHVRQQPVVACAGLVGRTGRPGWRFASEAAFPSPDTLGRRKWLLLRTRNQQ